MTSAARPTFHPARGGTGRSEGDLSALSRHYSSRDLPSHKTLKYRQPGQGSAVDLKGKDFKLELEEKERAKRKREDIEDGKMKALKAAGKEEGRRGGRETETDSRASKKPREEPKSLALLDADDPSVVDSDDDDDGDAAAQEGDDDDDSDDEMADLEMEMAKIKKEREAERREKEMEMAEERERIRVDKILNGNPLLNGSAGANFSVKRSWFDDTVFKNCAKDELGAGAQKRQKHFINDVVRSEFHKNFMDKYIK